MKVLIVRLSSFGDILMTLPAVHLLKKGLGCEIHWVTHREYIELVKIFTDVNRVIGFPRHNFIANFFQFLQDLRQDEYELVVDMHGLFKSGLVTGLARGKRKIGPSFCKEGSRIFYSEIAKCTHENKQHHTVDRMLETVRYLGFDITTIEFPLSLPEMHITTPQPRIAIAPASRWHTKTWPARYFAELLKLLYAEKLTSLYLIGSKSEHELCNSIIQKAGLNVMNMAGQLSFPEAGSFIKQMDLLITNDSGPGHLAAAVGTPSVVLFGPTPPEQTAPYRAAHIVKANLPCQPCKKRQCKLAPEPCCMTAISPAYVCQIVLSVLQCSPDTRGL